MTGRFQPLHLDHLELLLHALDRHERLVVGITNPDPSTRSPEASNPSRHLAASNPFTYWERLQFVRAALAGAGVAWERVEVVPFPMHRPELGCFYASADAVQYVRVYSPWEHDKVERLRAHGWSVVVLDGSAGKARAGSAVREALAHGEPWRNALPAAVAELVERFLAERSLEERSAGMGGGRGRPRER